jgi:isopentenyldiphosphate isomerase
MGSPDELYDILDDSGNPLGKQKARYAVHRDGDWHGTVHVWLLAQSIDQNTGKKTPSLLLQKRAAHKDSHPLHWDISAAGHIDAGEEALTAAIRETQEELGVLLPADELEFLFTNFMECLEPERNWQDREVQQIYLWRSDLVWDLSNNCLCDGESKYLLKPNNELAGLRLVSFSELEDWYLHPEKYTEKIVPHNEEYQKLLGILKPL